MNVSDGAAPQKKRTALKKGWIDLTPILSAWPYDEGRAVRRIRAENGREVLQVRLPLGIEQYEIDGRPDGKRPMDAESWLDYYLRRAKESDEGASHYRLKDDEFTNLKEEGLLYYYRYLLFFQVHEYRLCARDTRRNLKLLDFVARHCTALQAEQLEQYRPYMLRMNYMARALLKIQQSEDIPAALRLLQAGAKAIEELSPIEDNQIFEFERTRSLRSIEDLIGQLEAHVPKHVALRSELERAVREENYERAAVLRDKIAELKKTLREE
jgi:hypothetical protein